MLLSRQKKNKENYAINTKINPPIFKMGIGGFLLKCSEISMLHNCSARLRRERSVERFISSEATQRVNQ